MPIKTFRGKMGTTASNNAQIDNLLLHTRDGSTGYRIVKFELMPYDFGATNSELEATVKIYKVPQTTADALIDFSDNTLAAAAVMAGAVDAYNYGISFSSVFDNEIFNQDITLTYYNNKTNEAAGFINYYIELEQVKLDLNENTVATLKDIRNITG
jgi:hypothetical protein